MKKIMFSKKIIVLIIAAFIIMVSAADGLLTSENFKQVRGSVKVYDSDNHLLYESINGLEGYQTPVDINMINDFTVNAVIASEDERYFKHFGVDPAAIIRAFTSNIMNKRIISGGSTITQQVARDNLAFKPKNIYLKKLREINSALYLELFYTKKEILEKYLTNVYFGNNSYGIESASQFYFSKPASQLTIGESAALAGCIKSPVVMNPLNNNDPAGTRNFVLKQMENKGYLTPDQYEEEISYPLGVNTLERQNTYMHFVEYSLNEAREILGFDEISDLQGYRIVTTMSRSLSRDALDEISAQISKLKAKHKLSNASVVVLNTEDSAILVMIGSADYFDEKIDGAVNVAVRPRQPGSALKPFTYGQAFYENLLTPEDIIKDEKTTFIDKSGESFVPYNYNGKFNGDVSVRTALGSSLNLPAVKVLEMVGVEDMISAVLRAGVNTLNNPDRYDLSVTLGGGEVTLLDLTNAYNSLARGGYKMDVFSVKEIFDYKNSLVYEHKPSAKTEIWGDRSEEISNQITSILSDPSAKVLGFGRNNVLILPFESASKTGTTTDWHDNWTFGYTKKFTSGVWVGNSDNSPMYDIDGVTGAGPIWREVMISADKIIGNKAALVYANKQGNKENEISPEAENSADNDHEDLADNVLSLKILNPSNNSEYYLNPSDKGFEKIALEVSFNEEVNYVEYYIDGSKISGVYKKDNFKYNWVPKKGRHELTAYFYNSREEVTDWDKTFFTVY